VADEPEKLAAVSEAVVKGLKDAIRHKQNEIFYGRHI